MQQSPQELVEHLREQMLFLRNSAAAYDRGEHAEIKRVATVMRVMLRHTGGNSKALLWQLGIIDKLAYRDHGEPVSDTCIFYTALRGLSPFGETWEPNLERPTSTAPFDVYWGRVVHVDDDLRVKRSDLVGYVADQDGGVHVDPTLKAAYADLSRRDLFRIFRNGAEVAPTRRPHLPLLRQFAAELDWTISEQAPALLGIDPI